MRPSPAGTAKGVGVVWAPPTAVCSQRASLAALLAQAPKGLVIDVGAFDGGDAVAYAKAGHEVLSFEPVPSKHAKIEAAFRASGVGSQITLHKVALSDHMGAANFSVSKPIRKSESNRVVGGYGSQQDGMYVPWSDGVTLVEVPLVTLDSVVGDREVLHAKIDAQGHDAAVIAGARKLISEHRIESFSIEVAPKLTPDPEAYTRIVRWVTAQGYACYDCGGFEQAGLKGHASAGHNLGVEVADYIRALQKGVFNYRGSDHGLQSEFVCVRQSFKA